MSDPVRYGLVFLVVLLTHFQEGITGFGGTALALPFLTLLLGLKMAVPVLVIQAWLLVLCVVMVSRRQIVWAEYRRIAALVGAGLPLGIWMAGAVPERGLQIVLAAFMFGVGIHGLLKQMTDQGAPEDLPPNRRRLLSGLLPLGGVIHGAFGAGGPIIVIYATRVLREKGLFRVTLCLLWLTVNTAIISKWLIAREISAPVLRATALCTPFTVVGMLLGNAAHHRMDEDLFRRLVYTVLIAAGVTLAWSLAPH